MLGGQVCNTVGGGNKSFKSGGSECPFSNVGPLEGGAKKKKKKAKRKAGPYALFVKKNFASVKKKNPKWGAVDCIKEIAKMWKKQKK
tara:strand:- start:1588 stop:1848 length:261 start_codon:yes stop_codon:yes gene_type:complete